MVCGKRRRFVLIRTGLVSSVEPESVSSVRKRKVWSVGREKGLFLSEQDVSLRWNQKALHFCTEKTWYGKEESKSKAGIAAAFGSVLDYNAGVAWAPTSKSTASDRSEIYLRNLSDLIANRGLRLSYRGPPHGWLGLEVFRLYLLSIIMPKRGLQEKHLQLSVLCLPSACRCEL